MAGVVYLDLDGTLFGPSGSILIDQRGRFTHVGVRALQLLHGAEIPVVLVSGRSRRRLEAVARALGIAGVLPEMGATDAGYPTAPGETVHDAIARTGVPDALLDPSPGSPPTRSHGPAAKAATSSSDGSVTAPRTS